MGRMKTFIELHIQPELWLKVYSQIFKDRVDIPDFLRKLLIPQDPRIIITGAGTSEFMGEVWEGTFQCCREKILFKKIITLLFNKNNFNLPGGKNEGKNYDLRIIG